MKKNTATDFENAGYSRADSIRLAADPATNWKAANGGKRETPAHHFGVYRTARQCVLGDLGEVLVTYYPDEPQALAALASLGDGYEIRPVTPNGQPLAAPASPLVRALFSAEAVAHLRGYEREILPLADLARGMQARIDELEIALRELHAYTRERSSDYRNALDETSDKVYSATVATLARPVSPLAPDNLKP